MRSVVPAESQNESVTVPEAQKSKTAIRIPGRYFREDVRELFRAIYLAGAKSKRPTDSERKIGYIDYSIGHDFREGFRQRPHGFDGMSISNVVKMKFELMISEERRRQEAELLHAYAEAARDFLLKAEERLTEIDTNRGSVVLLERERDKAHARARIRAREQHRLTGGF